MTQTQKDQAYIWHPFTQMKLAGSPIHIQSASGTYLFTSDGRKIIDAVSSWWVNLHGHSHPYIAKKIAEQALQLEHVIFAGFTHTPAISLAENLLNILPKNFAKVFYSDNGSTAVEVALKMALQYWYNEGFKEKTTVIAFENAYHGDTFGAMSLGGKSTFNAPFEEKLFDVTHFPTPHEGNIEALTRNFEEICKTEKVAAFIFEPLIQGASGMIMYSPENLDILLNIAKKYNVLCIADEVMTGFGRTGRNFAIDYLAIKPDIICLSKGITGGFMPLGVSICTEKIYQAFYADDKQKAFYHGHSYTANPLACAAGIASLELLLQENTQKQIQLISTKNAAFAKSIKGHPSIKEIRHLGTILAIELKTPENTSYFSSLKELIYDFCLKNNVLLRPLGNIIYVMPPYCISEKDLDYVHSIMEKTLDLCSSLPS